jgi:hypothetical protein
MSRITLSVKATDQMYRVKRRLNLDGQDDLYTLRIAMARSIQSGTKLLLATNNTGSSTDGDGKRKTIPIATLAQKDAVLFRALIQQFYGRKLLDEEYQELVLKHVEHGLDMIDGETEHFKGYEYLTAIAKSGISGLDSMELSEVSEPVVEGFDGVLSIRIGIDKQTSQPLVINFNKIDEHLNNYIGIVGKPGSGKTYFGKYFLTELRKASRFETNFVIFDYAKGDIADDAEFVRDTRAKVLSVESQPIPLNIFMTNEDSDSVKRRAAERIVETIREVENIGKVQENNLYDAIMSAYQRVAQDRFPFPDFKLVREELQAIKDTPDSLTSIFRPLTEHNLFATRSIEVWKSLLDKTVIFDIHKLPALKDLTVFLILNEMYRQLMLLPDSTVAAENQTREMRTVVVIDEAHHFLKTKKRVKILEKIIREIRSKGASVMLMSQSPDDYAQADFDFLAMLEFVYVLGVNTSSFRFLQQSFGLSTTEAKRLMQDVTELGQGEAFGHDNSKQLSRILLCK